jgi:putative endonuclease
MSSRYKRLYTGVTNDIKRRVWEHKSKVNKKSFTARYNIDRLVYYESNASIKAAIAREKKIKNWRREKRLDLIENETPLWKDLSDGWYD